MAKRDKPLEAKVYEIADRYYPLPKGPLWNDMTLIEQQQCYEVRNSVERAVRAGVRLGRQLERKKHGKA